MNTTGFIRGYMAKNMENEKFLAHVLECLGKEFDFNITLSLKEYNYEISIEKYKINLAKEECKSLQDRGAYALDKYILNALKEQGFEFNKERSQYIGYCYNIFYKNEVRVLRNS